jgi:hypothetical protein
MSEGRTPNTFDVGDKVTLDIKDRENQEMIITKAIWVNGAGNISEGTFGLMRGWWIYGLKVHEADAGEPEWFMENVLKTIEET